MATASDTTTTGPARKRGRLWIGAAVALLVAAGLVVFVVVYDSGDKPVPAGPTSSGPNTFGPVAVSADGLATLAKAVPDPIYWAGPRDTPLVELTRAVNGNVYVRYLPKGVEAGGKGLLLTVATYPFKDAFNSAKKTMAQSGTVAVPVGGGALAFHAAKADNSVYVAIPGENMQIEVFSPTAGEAARIVSAGEIVRAG